jgi:uncharacterized membrane protein
MVLELKVPHGALWADVAPLLPVFLTYVLSFIYLGIYWNNHHHLLHTAGRVNAAMMWANLHLLFWLSLVPFTTGWMGENHFQPLPVAVYGVVLLMCGASFNLLAMAIIRVQGPDSLAAHASATRFKGKASVVLYAIAIALAFVMASLSCAIYVLVAMLWFVPDRRIEKGLAS